MFGFKTIRESEWKASQAEITGLQKEITGLQTEIKGYYENQDEVNEYFRLISKQLTGIEMGKLGEMSREEIKKAYESIGPVMGVINYIADNVGEVAKYLELRDVEKDEYVEQHWVLELLKRPNDRFTRRKFFTAWAVNKLLFGDAFVYAPKEQGKERNIKSMYIIPGQRVATEKGGYDKPFKGIRLTGGAGNETIDLDGKVFESFDYNLDDTSFFGTSKVVAAAVYLTIMERSMGRQATTLKNGGPANIVTPAPASSSTGAALPQQIDDMEQKMNLRANANKNIAMRTAIQVHQLGDSPANLSILQSHKDAVNALCFVYKLPVDLYLGQAKYENAKEAKKTIYEQNAIPLVNEFAEDFIHYLDLDGKYELSVNTDAIEVLKEKRSDTLDTLDKMYASVNERRGANGYERIEEEWADKPIIPMGIQFGFETGFDISEE